MALSIPSRHQIASLLLCFCLAPFGSAAQEVIVESPQATAAIDETGYEGVVLVHDPARELLVAGHSELADLAVLPASTFKIFSAMVALETGVIADRHTVIKWDGVERSRPEINQDLDLTNAFRLSAVPHFQTLVRAVGQERMQHYIDAAGYGNQDISGGIDTFWLTGALRISAREQVAFLNRLFMDDLPFSKTTMASVREMMVTETTDDYLIRAKTGWATPEGGDNIGWWVGWVERAGKPVFFASMLQTATPGDNFGAARLALARAVLQQQGAL